MLALIAIFLVAWLKSCEEMSYRFSGTETMARVDKIFDAADGRRGPDRAAVQYSFRVDGERRPVLGRFDVPWDEITHEVGDTIPITYATSDPATNVPSALRSSLWLLVFGGFLASIIGYGAWLYVQAKRDVARYGGNR